MSTDPGRRSFLAGLGLAALGTRAVAVREYTFRPSLESFANPERGFYSTRMVGRVRRLDDLRGRGIALLLLEMDLKSAKTRTLEPAQLGRLRDDLDAARVAGLKVIFRAAYGFTDADYRADPRDLTWIIGHIGLLGLVLGEARDVVCGVQAGMLGPWGEWHGSNHGDPPSLASRRAVFFAWLDALPAPITVHVRRPMFIRDIFNDTPEPTAATAFDDSRRARTGWHNDSFLDLPDDSGTYSQPGWDREREIAWCERNARFAPFGGETVGPSARTPVGQAIREMERLHATYLNIEYHPRVIAHWRATELRGEPAFGVIARRLGHRFEATRLHLPTAVEPGRPLAFELELKNVGFAGPHLPRVVTVALFRPGAGPPVAQADLPGADPRRWTPEAGPVRLAGALPMPADLPPGRCRFALRLADPSDRLRGDGRFATRLGNADISFDERTGWNTLADDVEVG